MATNYDKLIATLREVFMLDKAELDFGIYRIMNQKRVEIEQFLEQELVPQVKDLLGQTVNEGLEEKKNALKKLYTNLQEAGVEPEASPKYTSLQQEILAYGNPEATENEVFSHLTTFFRRYYDNGDFISQRRYKKDVYAIPYEGEEVKLHWANADQYYIKTSEYLKNYGFKLDNGKRVQFVLTEASTEQNNNKTQGDKERRFALDKDVPFREDDDNTLSILFTYEPLDKKIKQKDLNEDAVQALLVAANDMLLEMRQAETLPAEWRNELAKQYKTKTKKEGSKDVSVSWLEYHITQYTARNTFDYFIHKDLGSFLTRELDFYIKNEVLYLDDISTLNTQDYTKTLSKLRAIKAVGGKIITFLAQLEDFQKKLWLKKKFVVESNYCITLDRIDAKHYAEIAKNKAQREEWVRLFAIDEIKAGAPTVDQPTSSPAYSEPLTVDFLKANPYLLLDTAFFSEEFKETLLGEIEELDAKTDGLMVNSENFQALNFLISSYTGCLDLVYIDPPYNTDGDGFVYKDSFRHSTWLSMMSDRLRLAKETMKLGASIFSSIDNREQERLKITMSEIFDEENFVETFLWTKTETPPSLSNKSRKTVEYVHCFEKQKSNSEYTGPLLDNGTAPLINDGNTFRSLKFPKGTIRFSIPDDEYTGEMDKVTVESNLIVKDGLNIHDTIISGNFKWTQDFLDEEVKSGTYFLVKTRMFSIRFQRPDTGKHKAPNNNLDPSLNKTVGVGTNEDSSSELSNIGITGFSFPKPVSLIQTIVSMTTLLNNKAKLLDFYAGSGTTGHAVINLNRDGGSRKYILVEMGSYFDTVTKPRIQKVVYSKDWKDGKPVDPKTGISHMFKYMRLESYEDTLNNLELQRTDDQKLALQNSSAFKEGYMLQYMLDVESQGSLLNLDWFLNPFEVYLNITQHNETHPSKIDLAETFNYLIGLTVCSQYATTSKGCKYKVVTGTSPDGEKVLVVWRNVTAHTTPQESNNALNEYLERSAYNPLDTEYDVIYVNGDNNVENLKTGEERWKVRLIEHVFSTLMFS